MEINIASINKPNILIVEDDLICGFLAETALKNHYNTTIVTNGYDALQAIEKQTYNVILMDINLNDPAMDGLKTMRTIKFNRKHKYIKILAVTASSDDKVWFLKQGFDGHLMKPLLEREIVTEIEKHIKPNVVVVKKTKLSHIV
jgi:CheY-like chemotaxis protein